MAIKSLYRDYVQKSKIFLYPALEIKRGVSVTPIQTYVSWKGKYTLDDCKFITLYHLRDDEEFKVFEKKKLLGNPLFHDFFEVGDSMGIYVFDFTQLKHDWECFIHGGYSHMSLEHKKRIREFFKDSNTHYAYVESYLYPQKYFDMYANMLVHDREDAPGMKKLVTEVGELCSVPDFEQEHLVMETIIKQLDFKTKNL